MINMIKNWAYSVCIASIVVTMLAMLTPNGKMEKIIRFTVSLFFVTLLLAPIANGFSNYRLSDIESTAQTISELSAEETRAVQATLYEKKLEDALTDMLIQIGVEPEYLSADININAQNCIDISNITIGLHKSDRNREEEIRKLVKREVNCEPTLK